MRVPCVVITCPFTWTRPAAINSSAWRREAMPACARKRDKRSSACCVIYPSSLAYTVHTASRDRLVDECSVTPVADRPHAAHAQVEVAYTFLVSPDLMAD